MLMASSHAVDITAPLDDDEDDDGDAGAGGGGDGVASRENNGDNALVAEVDVFSGFCPRIVEVCCAHLMENADTEGVFRIPGSISGVAGLRQRSEKEGDSFSLAPNAPVHDVGSLVKGFLRELPVAVIPPAHKDLFAALSAKAEADPAGCVRDAAQLVKAVPLAHRCTLLRMLELGHELTVRPGSKMSAHAVAIVYGPVLLLSAQNVDGLDVSLSNASFLGQLQSDESNRGMVQFLVARYPEIRAEVERLLQMDA
jgi:RhoGAP domain